MTTRQGERILLASPHRSDAMHIQEANPWLADDAIETVGSTGAAVELLADPRHSFTLALIDRDLGPDPAPAVFHFVRRAADSPYPGLALGLIGSGITPLDVRRAVQAGCLMTLSRPFDLASLGAAVHRSPMDRTDFILSGAYTGPDRRRVADGARAEPRRGAPPIEQVVASTAPRYDIAPETTGFRFKRLRADASPSAGLALRNGLRRATLAPAAAHIVAKKREGLGLLDRRAGAMDAAWRQLQATLAPLLLARLNDLAFESSQLASQRGLTLLAAITRSLAAYSAGRHRLGPRLVEFLRAHLDGVGNALRHRIEDDGGPVGRHIMAALKDAERRFVDPDEAAGQADGAGTGVADIAAARSLATAMKATRPSRPTPAIASRAADMPATSLRNAIANGATEVSSSRTEAMRPRRAP